MKKAILSIVLVMCFVFLSVACDDKVIYSVTLDFDSACGSIQLSGNKTEFEEGEDVTFKVTPNENYKLESLLVGDKDVMGELVNGVCTFEIESDVTIKASFVSTSSTEKPSTGTDNPGTGTNPGTNPGTGTGNGKITITTEFDSSKGRVTLSPNKTSYEKGEQVSVRFRALDGYKIGKMTVNGENQIGEITNDVYVIRGINESLTIKVEFKDDKEYLTHLDESTFDEAIKTGKVIVEFGAVWCGPCKYLVPLLEDLSELGLDGVKVCQVDIDESPKLANTYDAHNLPTLIVFENGVEIARNVGWGAENTLDDLMKLAKITE